MTWDRFASAILSIPLAWKWALAAAGVAIGLAFILRADGVIRGLRKWLLFQLRLVRRPGYRRMPPVTLSSAMRLRASVAVKRWTRLSGSDGSSSSPGAPVK